MRLTNLHRGIKLRPDDRIVTWGYLMIRVPVTALLMVLVALPHGVCFCHFVSAETPHEEQHCCQSAACLPAAPADEPCHDDADCSCKLRDVAAVNPGFSTPDRDDHGPGATFQDSLSACYSADAVSIRFGSQPYEAIACHVPPQLRALLI